MNATTQATKTSGLFNLGWSADVMTPELSCCDSILHLVSYTSSFRNQDQMVSRLAAVPRGGYLALRGLDRIKWDSGEIGNSVSIVNQQILVV